MNGWQDRLPDGVQHLPGEDDHIRVSVSFPVDEAGLSPAACPVDPEHVFKLLITSPKEGDQSEPAELDVKPAPPKGLWCPYCGEHRERAWDFLAQHLEIGREAMAAAAHQWASEQFGDMLRKTFGSSSARGAGFRYTPGSPPSVKSLPQLHIEETRRSLTCAQCSAPFAVYGIAAFCPECGRLDSLQAFAEGLVAHRAHLAVVNELSEQERRDYAEAGLLQRAWDATVKDGIGALETLLKETFRQRAPETAQPRDRGAFQRFGEVATLYRDHLSLDLPAVLGTRWDRLLVFAAMRHVLTHNQGVIDEKFMERVPDWPQPLGARLRVTRTDAAEVLDVLDAIAVVLAPA
jgi:hypothetical protein